MDYYGCHARWSLELHFSGYHKHPITQVLTGFRGWVRHLDGNKRKQGRAVVPGTNLDVQIECDVSISDIDIVKRMMYTLIPPPSFNESDLRVVS